MNLSSSHSWLLIAALVSSVSSTLGAESGVSGVVVGVDKVQHPVWAEAARDSSRRFTFRVASPTVPAKVRETLSPSLSRDVLVVAMAASAPPGAKFTAKVLGGRTIPSTVVVNKGASLAFENRDPIPHRLYAVGGHGFVAADQPASTARSWSPPGAGAYEVRDELAPSVRTWVVVDNGVVAAVAPDEKGAFKLDLPEGQYQLRVYVGGKVMGSEVPVVVAPGTVTKLKSNLAVVSKKDG